MTKYEETVENLLITFDTTRARYLFTCETLLAPLMLKPDQYHVLINDPSKVEAWADKDLQASLRDRLGIAWNPYVELVKRVHKALLKFAGKMEIEIQERTKVRVVHLYLDTVQSLIRESHVYLLPHRKPRHS